VEKPGTPPDRKWVDEADPRALIVLLLADHLTAAAAVSPDETRVLAETLGALRQVEIIRRSGDLSSEATRRLSVSIVDGFEKRIDHLRALVEPA
jgi:hypothetical protein